ncbi:NUDIX domain-containing protein [Paenisporosarcina sp. TG20]|uniref:NUDIX hydrolase n=1 Tax=Paenisporosarcina sp. TG20 TaxID=1211706 RepID=UPI0002FD009B|nr:NUDIX domain-containing protein [Paenisporosarcina sp. TG20]
METKLKVLAYITREKNENMELLVFEHKDYPEAGLQVPGGTVEENERLIDAMYREIIEETGIVQEDLCFSKKLYTYNYYPINKDIIYKRNFFHFSYLGNQNVWDQLVSCDGEDDGLTFQFRWERVTPLPLLAGGQGIALDFLKKFMNES